MNAIRTKYLGPTNSRGSRIIASDGDKHRLTLSYDAALSSEDMHRKAATALRDKMGETGILISGWLRDGEYVWVVYQGGK